MVYMTFPKQLSEQEQELQRKFAHLRKLKKQLSSFKAAAAVSKTEETEKKMLKRANSEAAEAATEQAKKLLKSGVIKVDSSNKSKQFKRARIDRGSTSKSESEKPVAAYKPYSMSAATDEPNPPRFKQPNLRDTFVPASSHRDPVGLPKRGPRIYVRGEGLTEALAREIFSKAGSIQDVTMEHNKCSGFVTYEAVESADEAVSQFNGSSVSGVKLYVEVARKQKPNFHNRNHDNRNKSAQSNAAGSGPSQGPPEDGALTAAQRDVVTYDADDMFG